MISTNFLIININIDHTHLFWSLNDLSKSTNRLLTTCFHWPSHNHIKISNFNYIIKPTNKPNTTNQVHWLKLPVFIRPPTFLQIIVLLVHCMRPIRACLLQILECHICKLPLYLLLLPPKIYSKFFLLIKFLFLKTYILKIKNKKKIDYPPLLKKRKIHALLPHYLETWFFSFS